MSDFSPSFEFENAHPDRARIAGVDEVGCGPWAGPLVVSACILNKEKVCPNLLALIQDSKKLSRPKRLQIFEKLIQDPGVTYSLSIMEIREFNDLGLRNALPLTIKRAVEKLNPDYVLLDGNKNPKLSVPTQLIVKGDQKSYSIAAASIIAKVTRDKIMDKLHEIYPVYGWNTNAGYGTKDHSLALDQYGITPEHRTGYKPIMAYL